MLTFRIISLFVLTFLSGTLYRLGGEKNTKIRDFGVPTCALLLLWISGGVMPWWSWLLTFSAMFGVMTTYFKFGKQEDVYWYNWLVVGFMFGLSAIFYSWRSGNWLGFFLRTGLLMFAVMFWSEKIDDVEYEERGRGWLFTGTIPLLLI